MKAQLTHIAISAVNPPLCKDFYSKVLGLRLVSNNRNGGGFLTDGYINFALNYRKPGYQAGLDHFGFEVDNLDDVRARLSELYPEVGITTRPSHRGYVGMASHDPEGRVFDLTYAAIDGRRRIARSGPNDKPNARRFHHLAMRSMKPRNMAQFYVDVLDLQWARKPVADDKVFHLTDGTMTFVIMPWVITDFAEAGIVERPALDHIGFTVESIDAYSEDLQTLIKERPDAAPWADKRDEQRLRDERAARERLLAECEYSAGRLWDPEGVFFDVRESAK